MKLSDIIKHLKSIFETKKKNLVQLENDSNLESKLKPLKVSDKNTPIHISEDAVDISGSLKVNGVNVASELNDLSDVTYSSGDLTINLLDRIIADEFIVDSGASITLDSNSGNFSAKKAGTEFSVASSAYAGMILGYRMIGEDAGHSTYTLTTSYVVPDSAMTVRFIAPPSGNVEVMVQVHLDSNSNRSVTFGLSDNATYNSLGDSYEQITGMVDETDKYTHQHYWTVTGLTAGSTYNYWLGASANGGGVLWGGTGADRYCDFIMKVTALPAAVSDFAEYD